METAHGVSCQEDKENKPTQNELLVLWSLYRAPHRTQRQMANELNLTFDQVKHTIEILRGRHWVKEAVQVDMSKLGFPERYRVDIWIDPRRLRNGDAGMPGDETAEIKSQRGLARYIVKKVAKLNQFQKTILVEDIRILLGGPADLTAIIRARNNAAMLDFITDGLRMCGAIANTSTCLEQWSYQDGELSSASS